jgi:voltage-dependent potassium channel beta subunit
MNFNTPIFFLCTKNQQMEYRRLGKSGLKLSVLSLGSWVTFGNQIGDDVAEKLMKIAYENGVNFFDNAEVYARGKSEKVMGKILKKMKWERDSYCVSSKVFFGIRKGPTQKGLHRKHVFEACHQALQRLGVEYLDLFFCHRADPETPIEETVWMMHNLVQQGKILYWGTSEWSAEQISEAHTVAEKHHLHAPTMEQPQYNLLHRKRFEEEYAMLFARYGMGTTIWSPLASGLLTGKYLAGEQKDTRLEMENLKWLKEQKLGDATQLEKVSRLKPIADDLGISLARMSIAWCLKNPNVSTVILGATRVAQLKENLTALDVLPLLTEEVMKKIDSAVS